MAQTFSENPHLWPATVLKAMPPWTKLLVPPFATDNEVVWAMGDPRSLYVVQALDYIDKPWLVELARKADPDTLHSELLALRVETLAKFIVSRMGTGGADQARAQEEAAGMPEFEEGFEGAFQDVNDPSERSRRMSQKSPHYQMNKHLRTELHRMRVKFIEKVMREGVGAIPSQKMYLDQKRRAEWEERKKEE
jgi:hypothetical protein